MPALGWAGLGREIRDGPHCPARVPLLGGIEGSLVLEDSKVEAVFLLVSVRDAGEESFSGSFPLWNLRQSPKSNAPLHHVVEDWRCFLCLSLVSTLLISSGHFTFPHVPVSLSSRIS